MSLQCNVQHASEFIAWLGQVPLFTIAFEGGNPAHHEPQGKRLEAWLCKNAGSNVYYSCAAFDAKTKKKPTKADLVFGQLLQVDLDVDDEHTAGPILAALRAFTPEPSCIIMTGGGYQALWKLSQPVVLRGSNAQDIDVIESRNRWLLSQFKHVASTDGTWNADRLLRLPGSINVLNAKKVAAGREPALAELVELNDNVYDISVFKTVVAPKKAPSPTKAQPPGLGDTHPPIESLVELDLKWKVPLRVREVILYGMDAKAHDDSGIHQGKIYDNASDLLFDAICNLRRHAVPEAVVYGLLMDPRWGVHTTCVAHRAANGDYKHKEGPHRYALRQIEQARDKSVFGEHVKAQSTTTAAASVTLSWVTDNQGNVLKKSHNVMVAVGKLGGVPTHDALSDRVYVKGYPQEHLDDAIRHTMVESDLQFNVQFKVEMVRNVIEQMAKQNSVHPVQQYLKSLVWDGVPRLDSMHSVLLGAADTKVHSFMVSKWMISAAARALRPGCQVDYMLILEGEQGIKKSTALETLFGHDWTNTTYVTIDSKDALSSLRGKWLRVFEECAWLSKKDSETVKAFLTAKVDSYRPSYARSERDFPRQCVFAGTTNKENYLVDETGGRRFWSLLCTQIDVDGIRSTRDQLWAEATHRFFAGEAWWPESDDIAASLTAIQDSRNEAIGSPLDERIGLMLGAQQGRVHTSTIIDALRESGIQSNDLTGRAIQMKISPIMKRLGWHKSTSTGPRYYTRGSHETFLTTADLRGTMIESGRHLAAVRRGF